MILDTQQDKAPCQAPNRQKDQGPQSLIWLDDDAAVPIQKACRHTRARLVISVCLLIFLNLHTCDKQQNLSQQLFTVNGPPLLQQPSVLMCATITAQMGSVAARCCPLVSITDRAVCSIQDLIPHFCWDPKKSSKILDVGAWIMFEGISLESRFKAGLTF